ncbi:hypothetical protein ACFVTC_19860 [Streptomyces sp. NPDC057950]|uniref:hypothetical protein n=1 Tax=Streptomyces sp. NPDC057950 TaxID=3346288 RepID=UPI0036E96FD9
MDIVMLGHGGVGKSSYLSLMYAAMRDGIQGFGLCAQEASLHEELTSEAEEVLRGRRPGAERRRDVLDLLLHYQGRAVLPVRWCDHRYLPGQAGEGLFSGLTRADGIMVFADAPRLLGDDPYRAALHRMATLVRRALAERDGRLTPLVLVFTKCDRLTSSAGTPAPLDLLLEPFEDVIAKVAVTENLRGAVALVACGREPEGVTVPVLWILHHAIVGRGLALHAALTPGRVLAPADKAAEYGRLEPLFAPAERLATLLTRVPSF